MCRRRFRLSTFPIALGWLVNLPLKKWAIVCWGGKYVLSLSSIWGKPAVDVYEWLVLTNLKEFWPTDKWASFFNRLRQELLFKNRWLFGEFVITWPSIFTCLYNFSHYYRPVIYSLKQLSLWNWFYCILLFTIGVEDISNEKSNCMP